MQTIRKAVAGEEETILSFYENLIEQMRGNEFRPTWTKGVYPTIENIRTAVEQNTMILVLEDGQIEGSVICNHTQGKGYDEVPWGVDPPPEQVTVLHLLAADPRKHNQGIGRALLGKAEEISRAEGALAMRLDTLPWNKPARHLYESFGFVWRGDVPLFYPSAGTIPFSMYECLLA